ncbi:twin-arginine translocation pathway signal [Neisseria meningitidis]|nr:twin-arginine translocation pathway signal [Neisseria meningitidis]MBG8716603.1 twin-arginine translocation pathway signal [Neisseria meningitidis]MBG8740380.1 twin-arginine translocation pathway signal [Neisseria meningitidis]MBG8821157.1 twin-arginine translocation pathway signal [Neisseria meningitidis]
MPSEQCSDGILYWIEIENIYTVMPATRISGCGQLSGKTKNLPPPRRRKSGSLKFGCFK